MFFIGPDQRCVPALFSESRAQSIADWSEESAAVSSPEPALQVSERTQAIAFFPSRGAGRRQSGASRNCHDFRRWGHVKRHVTTGSPVWCTPAAGSLMNRRMRVGSQIDQPRGRSSIGDAVRGGRWRTHPARKWLRDSRAGLLVGQAIPDYSSASRGGGSGTVTSLVLMRSIESGRLNLTTVEPPTLSAARCLSVLLSGCH
jgi:hypothetical protein